MIIFIEKVLCFYMKHTTESINKYSLTSFWIPDEPASFRGLSDSNLSRNSFRQSTQNHLPSPSLYKNKLIIQNSKLNAVLCTNKQKKIWINTDEQTYYRRTFREFHPTVEIGDMEMEDINYKTEPFAPFICTYIGVYCPLINLC